MSVQFNEQQVRRIGHVKPAGGPVNFLLQKKIAKDEQQANKILLIFVFLCVILISILMWPEGKGEELTPSEIQSAGDQSELQNN